jgi:hypothetical protein
MPLPHDVQRWIVQAATAAQQSIPQGIDFMLVLFGPRHGAFENGCIFTTTADKKRTLEASHDLLRKTTSSFLLGGVPEFDPKPNVSVASGYASRSAFDRLDAYASGADELELPMLDADLRQALDLLQKVSRFIGSSAGHCTCPRCEIAAELEKLGVSK